MLLRPSIFLVSALFLASFRYIEATKYVYAKYDPHIQSVQKGYELCDYSTDVWFPCFESGYFSAYCIFSKAVKDVGYTYVSAIQLKFTANDAKTIETYTLTEVNVPLKSSFDSGSTFLYDQYGNGWLKFDFNSNYDIKIWDENTKTLIEIKLKGPGFHLDIFANDDTALWATGLLITGCPNGYVNMFANSGRRKRAAEAEAVKVCSGISGSEVEGFDDKVVQLICQHDYKYTPDIAKWLIEDVESVNRLQAEYKELEARANKRQEANVKL